SGGSSARARSFGRGSHDDRDWPRRAVRRRGRAQRARGAGGRDAAHAAAPPRARGAAAPGRALRPGRRAGPRPLHRPPAPARPAPATRALSLHDALPISVAAPARGRDPLDVGAMTIETGRVARFVVGVARNVLEAPEFETLRTLRRRFARGGLPPMAERSAMG